MLAARRWKWTIHLEHYWSNAIPIKAFSSFGLLSRMRPAASVCAKVIAQCIFECTFDCFDSVLQFADTYWKFIWDDKVDDIPSDYLIFNIFGSLCSRLFLNRKPERIIYPLILDILHTLNFVPKKTPAWWFRRFITLHRSPSFTHNRLIKNNGKFEKHGMERLEERNTRWKYRR